MYLKNRWLSIYNCLFFFILFVSGIAEVYFCPINLLSTFWDTHCIMLLVSKTSIDESSYASIRLNFVLKLLLK